VSPAWTPSAAYLERSRLRRFAAAQGLADQPALLRWATDDLERFWRAVDADLGLVWSRPYERAMDTARGIPWTTWWTGGRLNYVETALRRDRDPAAIALIAER